MNNHFKVIVVGGGTAGITVAARLLRASQSFEQEVAIFDPADMSLLSTSLDISWCWCHEKRNDWPLQWKVSFQKEQGGFKNPFKALIQNTME